MQRIERQPAVSLVSFSWILRMRRFMMPFFLTLGALTPVVTIPGLSHSPEYVGTLVRVTLACVGVGVCGIMLFRTHTTRVFVPYAFLAYLFFLGVLILATLLRGGGFDGFFGHGIDVASVVGVGSAFVLGLCMVCVRLDLVMLRYVVVGAGVSMFVLAACVVVYGIFPELVRLPVAVSDVTPVAGMLLLASIVVLQSVRTLVQYGYAVGVVATALLTLVLGHASFAVWIGVGSVTGLYTLRYLQTLLHQALRPAAIHAEHLLGQVRGHSVHILTTLVFFVAVAMVCVPQLSMKVSLPAFAQSRDVATTAETIVLVRDVYARSSLFGNGLGDFAEEWYRTGLAASIPAAPPQYGVSILATWGIGGGLAAVVLWVLGAGVFLGAGIRTRYLPRLYGRGWYVTAHASWVAAAFGIYSASVSTVGTVSLTLLFLSMALFFHAYRELMGEGDGMLALPSVPMLRKGLGVACVILACTTMVYVVRHVQGELPLSESVRVEADSRIVRMQEALGSVADTGRLIEEMREGTQYMSTVCTEYLDSLLFQERCMLWFTLLGSAGIEGAYDRAVEYAGVLAGAVPHSALYQLHYAEVLVLAGRADDAYAVLDQDILRDTDDARRVRMNGLLGQRRFDEVEAELKVSPSFQASVYGQLMTAALLVYREAFDEAGIHLDRFILQFPEVAEGYVFRAHVYRVLGNEAFARATLERGLQTATAGDVSGLRAALAAFTSTGTIIEPVSP